MQGRQSRESRGLLHCDPISSNREPFYDNRRCGVTCESDTGVQNYDLNDLNIFFRGNV